MKTLTSLKKYFLLVIVSVLTAKAQSLTPGDIAIIGFNFDGTDQIAFVALTEIPSGTEIKFTENGWKSSGSFRTGEGTFTYTAASTIAAGTVVDPGITGLGLAAGGDQVIAYQGESSSPTFIYAFNNYQSGGVWQSDATNSNSSALPTGLTNGTTAIAFQHRDNGYYSGTVTGTKSELLTAISDPANWTTSNDRLDSSNWVAAFTVSGDAAPDTPGLVLSQTDGSTGVTEGGVSDSFDVALNTLPSNDVTVTLTPGADVDLGSGAGVAIDLSFTTADGTSAQTVTVTAFDDSDVEGTEVSSISISTASSDADYDSLSDQVDVNVSDNDFTPSGDLIITQYYEATSGSNKYIEVTNIGDSSIDLTGYSIVSWNNDLSEEYKTATALPDGNDAISLDLTSLGSIEPSQTMVFTNTSAVSPIASGDADLSLGYPSPFHFNGNDSIVIYNSATPNPANIVDAIGFTSSFEGGNKSFVRAGPYKGYDLLAGSNASSSQFDGVWTEITEATADAASYGDDEFIGTTALAVAPTAIKFATTSIVVAEDDGGVTADLTIEILNPDGVNSVSVDVVLNSGSSTADAADIDSYSTQTVTFPSTAISGAQQVVTITITNDSDVEVNEDAIFDLANISTSNTNVSIGGASTFTLTIQDNDIVIPNIIISEVADPNDNASGRFVELYNASDSTVDLAAGNWYLTKHVNNSLTGQNVALTGTIAPGATYVIGSSGFDATYDPITSDQTWGEVQSSNGDDPYALYFGGNNSTGTLVDILGEIGTDGTGQIWNYEDGRAVRKADVTSPDDSLFASDWIFYSDESTSNQPLTNGIANVADMTPGVHPDPLVDEPTGVTASAASDTEISVAFAAINSNDVIIVFDADGTFTAPTGSAPSLGDSFAGGTVVYVGQVSPFAHTGLTASTQYYYSVFSVNGTDYSSTVETNATTLVAGLIDLEDFEDTIPGWQTATVSGDDIFEIVTSTGTNSAQIDGSTNALADNQYLVSPVLDLSGKSDGVISFDFAGGYDNSDADSFELVYSTDYSGSGNPESSATWTEITFDFSTNLEVSDPIALAGSGNISLPAALDGEGSFYLAFRYTSDGTISNSERWLLDNILVTASDAVAADPVADYLTLRSLTTDDLETDSNGNGFTVLEEYLAGFGDGSGPDAISYGIDNDALTLTSDLESAPSGITVALQATSDLGVAFATVDSTTTVVDNSDGTYTRSYTETSPPAGDQRFLRLSITTD